MKCLFSFGWVLIVASSLIACVQAQTDSPKSPSAKTAERVIPLTDIWGFRMPGTKDLLKIEDGKIVQQVQAIQRSLRSRRDEGKVEPSGFAVKGIAQDALPDAYAVLVDRRKPSETFPAGSAISLVFYSYKFGRYVQLEKVAQHDNHVTIQYRFVPHFTKEITEHFALIPLAHCPEGTIHVDVEQVPMDADTIAAGWKATDDSTARKIVSGPYSFTCGKKDSHRTSSD